MSRLPLPETPEDTPVPAEMVLLMERLDDSPVTVDHIRRWTRQDPQLAQVIQFVQEGWPAECNEGFRSYWNKRLELSVQDGCLVWGARVVVPPQESCYSERASWWTSRSLKNEGIGPHVCLVAEN